MKNDKRIHLGNGFIYENGTIKESDNEDSQRNKEWLTHEECWVWVANSLKKIYKVEDNMKRKPMIEYLEIDKNTYVENDVIKTRINESKDNDECSWDELWEGVLKIMSEIRRYDETHN